jgi:septal ring factor EnvC (AmiA/AmiB activator)
MLRRKWHRGILLAAALLCCQAAADNDPLTRADAEARLAALKAEINQLQQELERARAHWNDEQASLRDMDLEIQQAALAVRQVESDMEQQQGELERLREQKETYLDSLGQRREILSRQIVSAYRMGRQSRLKLLLNQDSPARVGRMLAYFDYFSSAQASHIFELQDALSTLDRLQAGIDDALDRLRDVLEERQFALQELQEKRQDREALLAALARQIDNDAARLEEMSRNQSDLEALIRRLTDALADIPTDLGEYQHPRTLKGALPMPLDGRVLHAFGQNRAGGMQWQGWLITADNGAEVSAIAYGRVAYADWLRGYGLLMIIDHGEGFMSLYGNNESLLFEPGDWVQPGQSIGTVGANPGDEQGLYFELRNHGEAIDPANWINRR